MQIVARPTKNAIFAFYFISRPRQTFRPKIMTTRTTGALVADVEDRKLLPSAEDTKSAVSQMLK